MCDFVNKNLYSANYLESKTITPQPIRFGKILNHHRRYSTEDSKAASEEIQSILCSNLKRNNEYISKKEIQTKSSSGNFLEALSMGRNGEFVNSNCDSPTMLIFSMDLTNSNSGEDEGSNISLSPPSRSFNPILKNSGFNSNIYKREGAELGLLSFSPP